MRKIRTLNSEEMNDKYQNVQVVVNSEYTEQPTISFEDDSSTSRFVINLTTRNQNQIDLITGLASLKQVPVLEKGAGEAAEIYRGQYKSTITDEDTKDALELIKELNRNSYVSSQESILKPPSKNIRLLIVDLIQDIEDQLKQA